MDIYDYQELIDEEAMNIWYQWLKDRKKKNAVQPWSVVSKAKLFKVWKSFAKFGFVRNEKDLDEIITQIILNAARFTANTLLMGHTERDGIDWLAEQTDEEYATIEQLFDGFEDYCVDETGQWRISDRVDKLNELVLKIFDTNTPEERLIATDIVLNFVHQRSDIASLFVEGGKKTLNELSA